MTISHIADSYAAISISFCELLHLNKRKINVRTTPGSYAPRISEIAEIELGQRFHRKNSRCVKTLFFLDNEWTHII